MTAKSGVVCYTLARKSFDSLLGPIQDVWRFEALRKVPILFSLSNSQLFDLAQCMKYHTLQAGQIVFKKGEPGELLFVLCSAGCLFSLQHIQIYLHSLVLKHVMHIDAHTSNEAAQQARVATWACNSHHLIMVLFVCLPAC